MREFKDKVAVITGAASGIGRGLAARCAQEGMRIVLADIEENALALAAQELKAVGASVVEVPTDVSKARDVEALAAKALDAFDAVHLLCNNAGVIAGKSIWESTLVDWEWVLGVNLWGVIYGVRVFVPIMLAQDSDCHIVNTASIAGFVSSPGLGIYKVAKHGVVTLSETLYHELAAQNANVKVSVLCPAWVSTRLLDSGRNRPANLQNSPLREQMRDDVAPLEALRPALEAGLSAKQVADSVFAAIRDEQFYIFTHPEWKKWVQLRMEDILNIRNPTPVLRTED